MPSLLKARNSVETTGDRLILPVSLLISTVSKNSDEDFDMIYNSVINEGMLNPIIVWSTTVSGWLDWASPSPGITTPPPSLMKNPSKRVKLVKCGNNRLLYAVTAGYTHIDCIVCEDRAETSRLCTKLRKEWNEDRIREES